MKTSTSSTPCPCRLLQRLFVLTLQLRSLEGWQNQSVSELTKIMQSSPSTSERRKLRPKKNTDFAQVT